MHVCRLAESCFMLWKCKMKGYQCFCLEILLIKSQNRKEFPLSLYYWCNHTVILTLKTQLNHAHKWKPQWNGYNSRVQAFQLHASVTTFLTVPTQAVWTVIVVIPVLHLCLTSSCWIEKQSRHEKKLNSYHAASCHLFSAVVAELKPLACQTATAERPPLPVLIKP